MSLLVILSTLCLPLASSQSSLTVGDLEPFLSTNGVSITRRVGSTQYEAQCSGGNAVWNISARSSDKPNEPEASRAILDIYLSVEFRVRQVSEVSEPIYLLGSDKKLPSVRLVPHLGNTVTALCAIKISETDSFADAGKALQECTNAVAKFAKKEFDSLSKVNAENSAIGSNGNQLQISYPDYDSIDRLVKYWKWDIYTEYGGNDAGLIPIIIDGCRAYLGVDLEACKRQGNTYFIVIRRDIEARDNDSEPWNKMLSARYRDVWAATGMPGHVTIITKINLRKKLPVTDLRNQIVGRLNYLKRIESEAR